MPQKILIDADPGIIDALVVLAALADPALEVLALTPCPGAVTGLQAMRNLQYLTGLLDPLRHPRIGLSDNRSAPADQMPRGLPHPQVLNGRFGLGETEPLVPDLVHRRESARLIVDLVREFPGELRIITLGPLTNIAAAIELDPEFPVLLNGLICLGGTLSSAGDVTASAEFNIWSDPQAARSVLRSPVGKIFVPLEIMQGPGLTFEDIDRLTGLIPSTPVGEFSAALLQFAARTSRQFLPCEEVRLPAATVLAIAAGAVRMETQQVAVDVETTGELTLGAMIVDRRRVRQAPISAELVTGLDHAAVLDHFCRGIRRAAVR
ncbi:MAG: nucleoside hydrolase [Planctomycetota bacterium]